MTEAEFQKNLCEAAQMTGWLWAHFRPAQTSHGWRTPVSGPMGEGFPDLVMTNPRQGRTIFVELKGDGGTLEPAQQNTLATLARSGNEVFVWWPKDWDMATEVLQGVPHDHPGYSRA